MSVEQQVRPSALKPHVRWMCRRDMPEVHEIENLSFEYAWTEDDFLQCMRQRNAVGHVADVGERVVAFMIYELQKKSLNVVNFAVHPDCRRTGVGRALVARMASKLSAERRRAITLTIRDGNLTGQLFFRACGFRALRVLPRYYEDSGDDGYLMVYRHGN